MTRRHHSSVGLRKSGVLAGIPRRRFQQSQSAPQSLDLSSCYFVPPAYSHTEENEKIRLETGELSRGHSHRGTGPIAPSR